MRGELAVKSAVVVLLWGLAVNVSTAKYSGGTGEPNNPYRIATANDLNDIGNHPNDWDKHFVMVNDINLAEYTGKEFNIIGRYYGLLDPENDPFTGVFDGNDLTISSFTYECNDTNYVGLFGYVAGDGEIMRLTLTDVNVQVLDSDPTDEDYIASLVGVLGGTIDGCRVEGGRVSGGRCVGGLVATTSGYIRESHTTATVTGEGWYVGGLVGETIGGTIVDSYATGDVTGGSGVGGLAGYNNGLIISSYATGSVSGQGDVGGLVADNSGEITDSHATGSVNGNACVGGLVGWNEYWVGEIIRSYATGDVLGTVCVGGLVGFNGNVITNSYAKGSVSGDSAGGLVGGSDNHFGTAEIEHSYSAGEVSGSSSIGGFVGGGSDTLYASCFWDTTVNPDVNGVGNANDPNVIGRSTAQMQTESTFTDAGWDFVEVWDIGENQTYPFLRVHSAGDLNHDGLVDWRDLAILAGHWLEEAGE